MEAILNVVTQLVTAAIGWIGQFADCIVATPLLLMFVVTAFVGLGVGLIKRIIRL